MNRPSPWRVRVSGPLQPYVVGFRAKLFGLGVTLGYSDRSCAEHLLRMSHVSCWLAESGLPPADLMMPDLERFLADRRQHSRVDRRLTLRAVQPLLDHLRGIGVVPETRPQPPVFGRGSVIEQFVAYLATERGLAGSTIGNYRDVAERFGPSPIL